MPPCTPDLGRPVNPPGEVALSPRWTGTHTVNEYTAHPLWRLGRPLRAPAADGHRLAREPLQPDLSGLRPLDHPMKSNESHRHAIDAQRPLEYGGGRCTLLVRRLNDQIELLFHATPETGAIMTPAQALEMAKALTTAAENQLRGNR